MCSNPVSSRPSISNAGSSSSAAKLSPAFIRLAWSNLAAQSASQSTVTLASAPATGSYRVSYYLDQNGTCTSGSNAVSLSFNWADGSSARVLTTGSLTLGSVQSTSGYLSGTAPLYVGSGNVTYTSTVAGSCTSGTSSYDVHVALERLQ